MATAVAASSVLGLSLAAAAPASAATGSKACTHQVKLDTRVTATATVNFRTGPGTNYTSLGLLPKGQGVYWACYKGNWGYLKPYYGAHKGHWGWVSRTYIDVPMRTD
ncbi:SH3 domain-containing protein [Streptomyces sp. NPDC014684]|uniref:SH3 domain-containing protein n=1 Tax=unclassified Streptomyces TaxID=2593676 RepID=UPI003401496D